MTSIGFTAATIGVMIAAYSALMFIIETPSGILADRWSRKGVLILASAALAASAIICGLSNSVAVFILGAVMWGAFFAMQTGTYDSIIYDTLIEETGESAAYERYYGRVRMMDGAGLVAGSLAGGVAASLFSLRATFFLSLPIILLSIVPLAIFKEPKLHKTATNRHILSHVKATFSAVIGHKSLVSVLIILVASATLVQLVMVFGQLWLIAISTPTIFYGPANALLLSAVGIAGILGSRLKLSSKKFIIPFIVVFLTAGLTLITVHSTWPLIISMLIVCVSLLGTEIAYLRRLHDHLPSDVRSGASSAVSTTGRALFVVMALGFGWLTQQFSVFKAAWLVFIPLVIISFILLVSAGNKNDAVLADK